MDDQVFELLKNSSSKVKSIKEKREEKIAKDNKAMEKFIYKARKNSIGLYIFLLKKAVKKYIDDPASILVFSTFVRDKNYKITYSVLDDSQLKGVPGIQLARKHNENIHSYSNKNRVVFYSEDGSNPIPVMISDLDACSFEYDDIVINFTNEFIRNLTIEAHENTLNSELYGQELIDLLKHAYNEVKSKSESVNIYLENIRSNAHLVYYDCYRRLIREYEKNNKDSSLSVSIKNANDTTDNIKSLFNSSSMTDEIVYSSYYDENGELKFVPVQLSVLKGLFEQDSNIGFKNLIASKFNIIVTFDTALFEDGLIKMNEEEENRKLLQ